MTDAASRIYPARPFLAASVAVFRNGKVLLAERSAPPSAFLFSLPGGLVELGETLAEAALRELFEETDVRARILAFNDHVEVIERDDAGRIERHFVVASFVAEWLQGDGVTGPEARRIVWVYPSDAGSLSTSPGLMPLLDRAMRFFPSQ